MTKMCPRADPNDQRNAEVVELPCPCGELIEFWKGDEERPCPSCGKRLSRRDAETQGKKD